MRSPAMAKYSLVDAAAVGDGCKRFAQPPRASVSLKGHAVRSFEVATDRGRIESDSSEVRVADPGLRVRLHHRDEFTHPIGHAPLLLEWSAAQARTEPRGLCRRSGLVERAMLLPRSTDPADGSAVDARGRHAHKEAPVEAGVTAEEGLVGLLGIQGHGPILAPGRVPVSPDSDLELPSTCSAIALSSPPHLVGAFNAAGRRGSGLDLGFGKELFDVSEFRQVPNPRGIEPSDQVIALVLDHPGVETLGFAIDDRALGIEALVADPAPPGHLARPAFKATSIRRMWNSTKAYSRVLKNVEY